MLVSVTGLKSFQSAFQDKNDRRLRISGTTGLSRFMCSGIITSSAPAARYMHGAWRPPPPWPAIYAGFLKDLSSLRLTMREMNVSFPVDWQIDLNIQTR